MNAEVEKKIKERDCIKNGTKEACIVIEEVLEHKMYVGNQMYIPENSVSMKEFFNAVKVLLAFANRSPDTEIDTVHCESDCTYMCYTRCPGQKANLVINMESKKTCPYYEVEDK